MSSRFIHTAGICFLFKANIYISSSINNSQLGTAAQACNPSYEGGADQFKAKPM
jgi:hypothetical protein